MKVEVAVLRSPSLIILMVSVHVKQHSTNNNEDVVSRAQELCESRGGRPGFSVPNNPYGFCTRKATFEEKRRHRHL